MKIAMKEEYMVGTSDRPSMITEEMREVMRRNSAAVEEMMLTKQSTDSMPPVRSPD